MFKKLFAWLFSPVEKEDPEFPFTVHQGRHGPVYRHKETKRFVSPATVAEYL